MDCGGSMVPIVLEQMVRLSTEIAPLSKGSSVESLTGGLGGFVEVGGDVDGCDIAEVGCC